ncbi:MAG: UDP-glucose 4-epimerase [Frondihabitans sp.]|nr:UDP-glucose 4-epimerase [Frondihabitans sp.]
MPTAPTSSGSSTLSRVDVTPEAASFLVELTAKHGPLMFHQSGGCCDGSSPMCYPVGFFRVGSVDVHLGDLHVESVEPIEVYMSRSQFEYWKYTHLTIDVVPGRGAGFSVESPEGKRFLIRSRMLTDEELVHFDLV